MRAQLNKLVWFTATLLVLGTLARPTDAALYWNAGVRQSPISVCFVGDALTSQTVRVNQVLDYIQEFEYAANIRFNSLGTCPDATKQKNGNDSYDGDIRVLLVGVSIPWTTGLVPGQGCMRSQPAAGESWSDAPDDLPKNRSCQYNLRLGDDPWPSGGMPAGNPPSTVPYLNHTLHEFGHALGLAHEHERNDVDKATCTASGYGGGARSRFLTPYDRKSVMHQQFLSCGINGNYDNTGLSDWDRLGLHILYPENARVAEYVGTTVIRTTDTLRLQSAWQARGANMSFVANKFSWTLSGMTVSTSPYLSTKWNRSAGNYSLQYSHRDFLGRTYSYTGMVRVLEPAVYNKQIAAPIAAQSVLLFTNP